MRRSDREVKDLKEILEIMKRCDVCRLALNDESGFPYIIPLNFGLIVKNDSGTSAVPHDLRNIDSKDSVGIRLFFHSALEGTKIDLMRRDPRASFEMDCSHELQYNSEKGYCTMAYESVIGHGILHILEEEEKLHALRALMDQYHPGQNAYFNPAAMARTLCYYLEIEALTAKCKLPMKMN